MDWTLAIICIAYTLVASVFVCKIAFPIESMGRESNVARKNYQKTKKEGQSIYQPVNNKKKMLYNEKLGIYKPYHEGFSWTVFLFGFIPALFREDWKWALIIFSCCFFTLWLPATIFFAIKYNELYTRDLLQKGYKIVLENDYE